MGCGASSGSDYANHSTTSNGRTATASRQRSQANTHDKNSSRSGSSKSSSPASQGEVQPRLSTSDQDLDSIHDQMKDVDDDEEPLHYKELTIQQRKEILGPGYWRYEHVEQWVEELPQVQEYRRLQAERKNSTSLPPIVSKPP
eukprot:TRINITY_DN2259_c0_g1_i5.p1 TRINITY_DN2259_c0_g1~~TRINITY_DN2259_c0_g1_i5.p1  ORF type:complete len:143 (+),score=7.56 TRINITY_DN2259_c0_g1_i5:249-677(+)